MYCDTLLYFSPPLSSPPLPPSFFPTPHHPPSRSYPVLFSPLLRPLLSLFRWPPWIKKIKHPHACSVDSFTRSVSPCYACVCASWTGLAVNCMCASCLCVSLRAAGNSKTRPYRPPRGLKAQEVPEQHGLNKGEKKHFKRHKGEKRQRICAIWHIHTHTRACGPPLPSG